MIEYRLVSRGSYDRGKIKTSILQGDDLVKVVISEESTKKKDNLPLWLTYIWDEKEKKIDMQFDSYTVDMEKDLVFKVEKGDLIVVTQPHEDVVNMLFEDLVKENSK